MDDSRTGVLAERQDATGCHLGIAQELQSHILVVLRSLRVVQDGSHLQVVLTTQRELHIVESLLSQQRQGLLRHLDNLLTLKLTCRHAFFREQTVFGFVFAQLEHWGVLEINYICHNRICICF